MTVSTATKQNFDPRGYIELNPDIKNAFGMDYIKAYDHLLKYGLAESRCQLNYSQIINARKEKVLKFQNILDLTKPHEVHDDGSLNFLSPELKEEFRVFDTSNISSNMYAYEGLENKEDCLILDCGAGFRNHYHSNVVYFEIVNYISTDIVGVGEQLPFKDNSFDAVFSCAVLEHVVNPQLCAAEIIRVCKPSGLIYCDAVFMQPYHGYPSHYFNFTPNGARLLFDKKCEVVSQTVPLYLHPIFSLQWICREWERGVLGNDKDDFFDLSVKELLDNPIDYFLTKSYVQNLQCEVQEVIAAGTRIIAKKIG